MKAGQRLHYQLHAKTRHYQRQVDQADNIIRRALERVRRPYVACSFGKDSSAMLDLVNRIYPAIAVRFLYWRNESDLIDNYQEVIDWWRGRNINLEIVEMRRDSLDATVSERWQTSSYDSYFIGFRADESKGRAATLRYNGTIYTKADGTTRIAPLAWWTAVDVGAYIEANGLPLLASYEDDVTNRTSSRVPRADYGIRERMLTRLKQRDPVAFNELTNRFPEAKEYV